MKELEIKKTGIYKGDWTSLEKAGNTCLWQVVTKEGAAHEVVTLNLYGEDLIIEVDEEKVW